MEDFENLDLPFYKVSILYKNGDVREFLSNDFDRADQEFRRFFSIDFLEKNDLIYRVRFFNGATGKTRFIDYGN